MSAPRSSPRLRVVVGGGIGSGKTTVVRRLAERGATVIVADEIGHGVLRPDGAAFAAVAEAWPQVVVSGEIDRRALAAIVFADGDELQRLEAMTHPAIAAEIARLVDAADGDVVLEVPVPGVATGEWVRVLVAADPELRMRRAVARGADPEDVRRRMGAQLDRSEWERWADHVIENDGSVADLEAAVDALWAELETGR